MTALNESLIILTTFLILSISLTGRFMFHTTSRGFLKKIKKKLKISKILRVHHVFIGLLIILISFPVKNYNFISLGIGISLSDIFHHVTLKIINGDSEFKLEDNKFI